VSSGKNDYERQDINPYKIIGFSLVGLIILVVIIIILRDYFMIEKEEIVYNTTLKPVSAELRDIHARETETLNNYKLLDKQKGIYQIPIERAMQLLAEESFQNRIEQLRRTR
jgi:hypothetical protein